MTSIFKKHTTQLVNVCLSKVVKILLPLACFLARLKQDTYVLTRQIRVNDMPVIELDVLQTKAF